MKGSKLVLVCLLLVAVALVVSAITASARPASPGFFVYTQPDGSKLSLSMLGSDERVKIGNTVDGYTLMPNGKAWCYAVTGANGDLAASNVKAHDPAQRGAAERAFVGKLAKGLKLSKKSPGRQISTNWLMKTYTGNVRICCLLTGFKDYVFTASTQSFINMLNQHGYQSPFSGQTGSYHEYMESQSGGLLNVTVDVKGPFKLGRNRSFYLADTGSSWDNNTPKMFDDVLVKADSTVNFALYDNDNNGTVDPCIVIAAGPDTTFSGDPNDVYPCTQGLGCQSPWPIPARTVDGKQACGFCDMGEWRYVKGDRITPVASVTHEYGHCMGRPDTYLWAGGGPNCYDQMSMGSWGGGEGDNPSAYITWHKIEWGWITPTVLSSAATGVTIANRYDNPLVAAKIVNATSGQYWLLENVKVTGWDAYCQNSGLLITHVASSNIEPADGAVTCGPAGQSGDVFPGISSNTSFTDTTTPNMKDTLGNNTGKPITNITYPSYVVTFDFMQ
jgi:M6 family metalloprotease-like protein